ncbi:hypothetical protein ACJZ2D_014484 [Fusarium nematophilum]
MQEQERRPVVATTPILRQPSLSVLFGSSSGFFESVLPSCMDVCPSLAGRHADPTHIAAHHISHCFWPERSTVFDHWSCFRGKSSRTQMPATRGYCTSLGPIPRTFFLSPFGRGPRQPAMRLSARPLVRDCPRIVRNRRRSPSIAIQIHITGRRILNSWAWRLELEGPFDPLELSTPLLLLAEPFAAFPL